MAMAAKDRVQVEIMPTTTAGLLANSIARTVPSDAFTFTTPFFSLQQHQLSAITHPGLLSASDIPASFGTGDFGGNAGGHSARVHSMIQSNINQNSPLFSDAQSTDSMGSNLAAAGAEPQRPKALLEPLLQNIIRYTQGARDAFSQNRESEGKQRVAELKAAVDLLQSIVNSSSKASSLAVSSLIGMSESTAPNISGTVPQSKPPGEDTSRKRCASAQGGDEDRVLKSLKLEPKDDPVNITVGPGVGVPASSTAFSATLSGQTALSLPSASSAVLTQSLPPPLLHSQTFPGSIHTLAGQQHLRSGTAFATPSSSRSESSVTSDVNSSNAALAHQLALMQHATAHSQAALSLSHATQHAGGILSAAPGPAIPNGSPSAQPPPSSQTGWTDSDMLAILGNISQSMPQGQPRYHQLPPSSRPSRSSSYSGAYPFAYDLTPPPPPPPPPPPLTVKSKPNMEDPPHSSSRPSTSVSGAKSSSPEQPYESDHDDLLGRVTQRTPEGHTPPPNNANEIPSELRQNVDAHFFRFLRHICSDLDAKDAKGEPIHQPLMAKKMARLDESPDWRPFKFRIQAFTNAFLEELAKQGLSEEVIPMKKVRHYLWTSIFISRFNEEGKKAKSKGNHIWNVDARKDKNGIWHFRPFKRKITGSFQNVAYVGLKWSFQPKIWDPQASRSNENVRYSSSSLPPWLSWNGDVLSGTPGLDTQSAEFVIEAKFHHEGKEQTLTQKYVLSVAPLTRDEPNSYSMGARRPSLVNDRRGISDSILTPSTSLLTARPASTLAAPAVPMQDALAVVTEAIKAVTLEANTVHTEDPAEQRTHMQSLIRQGEVLTVTANAINVVINPPPRAEGFIEPSATSTAIARAGTGVVTSALTKVAADITARTPEIVMNGGVSVQEVTSTTKSAVAQAVQQTNTTASPIEVLNTAEGIIQQDIQQPGLPVSVTASAMMATDMANFAHPLPEDISMQSHVPVVSNGLATPTYPVEMSVMSDYPMADIVPP